MFRANIIEGGFSCHHNSGFFSTCSILFYNIIEYIKKTNKLPTVIDCPQSFGLYKGHDSINGNTVFSNCFQISKEKIKQIDPLEFKGYNPPRSASIRYDKQNYQLSSQIINAYFSPSKQIRERRKTLIEKYNIVSEETLCICFRGTDKYKEVEETPYSLFCSRINEVVANNSIKKILVQTDQKQFLDFVLENYDDLNTSFILENPMREDRKQVMHALNNNNKREAYLNFLASMFIFCDCKFLINHTGNVGRWIAFFRGGAKDSIQYFGKKEFIS